MKLNKAREDKIERDVLRYQNYLLWRFIEEKKLKKKFDDWYIDQMKEWGIL